MIWQRESHANRACEHPARGASRARKGHLWFTLWLVLASATCFWNHCSAQKPPATREYKVKVAYIYNFTRYVSWPKEAFTGADSPFVIAVLGDDPFGATLDSLQQRRRAAGRRIVVRRYASLDEIGPAHVLFVSATTSSTRSQLNELVLSRTRTEPLLIVGETPGFANAGAPVNFFHDGDGTIGFELNVDAIARRGLKVDAKLLSIANVVRDGGSPP